MSELLGKEQLVLYNYFVTDSELGPSMKYLFDVETRKEKEEIRLDKKRKAKAFLLTIYHVRKAKNKEQEEKLIASLLDIDRSFKNVKYKLIQTQELSKEDIIIIAMYRLKYGIGRPIIAEELTIDLKFLCNQEAKIEDQILKERLSILNKYKQYTTLCEPRPKR